MPFDSPVSTAENPQSNGAPNAKNPSRGKGSSQKAGSYLPDIHRKLPQSLDAEKAVISSVLLSPNEVIDICAQRITAKHFYFPAHALIYQTILDLWAASKPIDLIVLTQELSDRGQLDQVGGAATISEIYTFVPTAANVDYYLDILTEKGLLREIITTCTDFAGRGYDELTDAKGFLDELEKNILKIGEERELGELPTMKELVNDAIKGIEELYKNRGAVTGLTTGFSTLDEMTNGLHGSEMIVLAARPSVGKTAFAMNIAEHVAIDANRPVAIFSLEMSKQQLVQRLLCSRARVNLKDIRSGMLKKQDLPNLFRASGELAKANVFIDDTPGLSILDLRAKCRRLHRRFGIELIVIDYLQLLRSTSRRAQDNRQLEIAEISYGVKSLAKELDIPILVLAQLNRNPDARGGKPRISDLRESGSIEQDADVVCMLTRPELYAKDEEEKNEDLGKAELIIAKQRNGPIGEIALTFLKEFTRFEVAAFEREPA